MEKVFNRFVLLLTGFALTLDGLALVDFLLHPLAQDASFHSTLYRVVVILVLMPFTLLVGFLIIRRVPGNVVGPLLIVWSGSIAYWSIRAEIWPELFALFYFYNMVFGWLGFFCMLQHFPNGKINPPGAALWIYPQFWITILLTCFIFMSTATFVPAQIANPFYLPALLPYADLILKLGLVFVLPFLVMSVVSPVLCYRKGSLRESQQIKWLALFAGFSVLYALLVLIAYPLLTGSQVMNVGTGVSGVFYYLFTGLFPPFAIGVAILRHRLWDIDLIIRQTLVYSILTVILSLIFFGSAAGLQSLFTTVIGRQSPAAIVLSTLAIAASITPLRRRIQDRIDRHFYRQKYNAEKVLVSFSNTLREKVDLDHLTNSILDVFEETMQPEHVSIWLYHVKLHPEERKFKTSSSKE